MSSDVSEERNTRMEKAMGMTRLKVISYFIFLFYRIIIKFMPL